MPSKYPVPATPTVISPPPTPPVTIERQDTYFGPVTRSATRKERTVSPQPIPLDEGKDGSGSDDSLNKRARTRSRSPILPPADGVAAVGKRRRMSGLSSKAAPAAKPAVSNISVAKSQPLVNGDITTAQSNGFLSPYDRVKKSWRDFSRSPSPLGLIPLHRQYRDFIHRHEIPRKLLHVSIGFFTLWLYVNGVATSSVGPYLLYALLIIAPTDVLRHRSAAFNQFYIKVLGALMRETEVDGYNGVIWYLLGCYLTLTFFPKDIGVVSILLLSFCDTAASTFGRLWGRYTIRLRKGKSLAGSLAAFVVGVISAIFFWGWLAPRTAPKIGDSPDVFMFQYRLGLPAQVKVFLGLSATEGYVNGTPAVILMSLATGLIGSVTELLDVFGLDDNLTIPVLSSISLWIFLKLFG
ncbi:hypothetical protein DV738_g1671, partial [Chaetothyriales sp. CBS 135597]